MSQVIDLGSNLLDKLAWQLYNGRKFMKFLYSFRTFISISRLNGSEIISYHKFVINVI